VKVLFSFDTEDFITPESDGIIRTIAEMLERRGMRATFGITADKARSLWTRGRKDVIDALKRHDVQYHANTHLIFPPTTETLTRMGWDEGVDFVTDTERHGVEDVSEVFGRRPVAWIRCGGNWDPREVYGMHLLGIRVHLPSRCVLPPEGRPSWYVNVLHARYDMSIERYFRSDLKLGDMKREFWQAAKRLSGTTLPIALAAHPCMFSTSVFWDVHNARRRGVFLPKHLWTPAPTLPLGETRRRLGILDEIARFVTGLKGCEIVTAADILPSHVEDNCWLTTRRLQETAGALRRDFNYQRIGRGYASVADIFAMLSLALTRWGVDGKLPARVPVRRVLGPPEPARKLLAAFQAPLAQVVSACAGVESEIALHHRLPSAVSVGERKVPPASFLWAMANALGKLASGRAGPVAFAPQTPYPRCKEEMFRRIKIETFQVATSVRPGAIVKYSHQQTWTLRPAVAV